MKKQFCLLLLLTATVIVSSSFTIVPVYVNDYNTDDEATPSVFYLSEEAILQQRVDENGDYNIDDGIFTFYASAESSEEDGGPTYHVCPGEGVYCMSVSYTYRVRNPSNPSQVITVHTTLPIYKGQGRGNVEVW